MQARFTTQGLGIFAIADPFGYFGSELVHSDLSRHSTPGAAVREAAASAAQAAAQAAHVDLSAVGDNVVVMLACPKPWPDEAIRGIQQVLGHSVQVVGGTPASSSYFGGRWLSHVHLGLSRVW